MGLSKLIQAFILASSNDSLIIVLFTLLQVIPGDGLEEGLGSPGRGRTQHLAVSWSARVPLGLCLDHAEHLMKSH